MIDYRTHAAALEQFRHSLAQSAFPDPQIASIRDQHLDDVARAPGMATLGSLVDHLIAHASSDGKELDLVGRAADLWEKGLALYNTLGEFRTSLENALTDPGNPQAVADFNAAAAKIHPLVLEVKNKNGEIQALKDEVHTFPHLQPHPRQQDRPLTEWSWGDVFLARRTDAFARTTREEASDAPTSAFALGVLSSYGANACGSAYLGQVVGGPRRSHRHRDRLARNTLGSWFSAHQPGLPSLAAIAAQIKLGAPTLPTVIEELIESAIHATYDPQRTPALPDLQLGYQRLIRHLELLDTFTLPSAPLPPKEPFLTQLYGDPAHTHVPAVPQGVGMPQAAGSGSGSGSGVVPQSNHPTGDGLGESDSAESTSVECGPFWEAIGWSLLFILGGWFYCVLKWGNGDRCPLTDDIGAKFDEAFPDGAYVGVETETSAQALTGPDLDNAVQVDQVTTMIGHLFDTQSLMWEALQKASDFLSVHGLIYPDGRLGRPRYKQFLSIPATLPGTWPHLPEPNANRLHLYPSTGTEQPAFPPPAYPPQATPDVFVSAEQGQGPFTASALSGAAWRQMAVHVRDATNYDLDADRGLHHACWAARGSINDNPVDVAALDYSET